MDGLGRSRPEFAVNATTKIGNGSRDSRGGATRTDWQWKQQGKQKGHGSSIFGKERESNFGTPTEGMENNAGKVFVAEGAVQKASDPASVNYDVTERYGRGATAKQARLRRQIDEEQLKYQITERFGQPKPAMSAQEAAKQAQSAKAAETILPVLPNGSAEMINAAYSTIEERKRKAALQTAATLAKRKKYTGVVQQQGSSDNSAETESAKLRFMKHSSSSKSGALVNGLPVPSSQSPKSTRDWRGADTDARATLVALASSAEKRLSQSAPSLKLKKAHRPRLRIPEQDLTTRFIGGERYHVDEFAHDDWEDDLAPLQTQSASSTSLFDKLASTSRPPTHHDSNGDDSDGLEIV